MAVNKAAFTGLRSGFLLCEVQLSCAHLPETGRKRDRDREEEREHEKSGRENQRMSGRENQRMSKRNLCLEFLWLNHNNVRERGRQRNRDRQRQGQGHIVFVLAREAHLSHIQGDAL